jgi:acyl-CoA synthetase (AMP-forming)/AMP-acid ligase II
MICLSISAVLEFVFNLMPTEASTLGALCSLLCILRALLFHLYSFHCYILYLTVLGRVLQRNRNNGGRFIYYEELAQIIVEVP